MPAALPPLQGNKTSNLSIVYTPASNLRKTADMAVGQVWQRGQGPEGQGPAVA